MYSAPDSPPENVSVTVLTSTTIMVTWESSSLEDIAYEILYRPLTTFDGVIDDEMSVNVSGSVMTVILMGLQEYVNYTISVRAYTTSRGVGNYSSEITVLTWEDGI